MSPIICIKTVRVNNIDFINHISINFQKCLLYDEFKKIISYTSVSGKCFAFVFWGLSQGPHAC